MWRIMFSSGITDGNIKIRGTAWGFNGNGCAQDLILFKSFSPSYIQYTLGLESARIIISQAAVLLKSVESPIIASLQYFCGFFFNILSSCHLVFDVI